jgi:hypothetical protein
MNCIVTDYRILNAMERHGFIITCPGKGRHWTGRIIRNYFVEDAGPKLTTWSQSFKYRGNEFRLRYFDGCFKPFVTRVGITPPAFV